jgi:hypothetical protein
MHQIAKAERFSPFFAPPFLNSTSTPPHTTVAKAMAVEKSYGVQVCDATKA